MARLQFETSFGSGFSTVDFSAHPAASGAHSVKHRSIRAFRTAALSASPITG